MDRILEALKATAVVLGLTLLMVAVCVGLSLLGALGHPVLAVLGFVVFFAGVTFVLSYHG